MEIKTLTENRNPLLYLIPAGVVCLYFTFRALTLPVGDFGNYYYASRFLVEGNWGDWIYEPYRFNEAIYKTGQRDFFLNYTPVPPLSALLYVPLTLLDVVNAKLTWNLINSGVFLLTLYRLQSILKISSVYLLGLVLLTWFPVKANLSEGQSYFLLSFLIVEGYRAYLQKKTRIYPFLWALAIHLKITPAFLLLFLLLKKDWKGLSSTALISLVMVFISIPWLHTETWVNYLMEVLPRLYKGEINNTYAINYQSAQVLLKTLFVPDVLHNPNAEWNSVYGYELSWQVFKWVITGIVAAVTLSGVSDNRKMALWLVSSLLISGYGNSFSLVLLMFPVATFWTEAKREMQWRQSLLLIAIILIWVMPFYWFSNLWMPLRFPRLFGLLLFFLILVPSMAEIKKQLYLPVLTCVLAIILSFTKNKPVSGKYLFEKEAHLLNYQYRLTTDSVEVCFFDINGPATYKSKLPFSVHSQREADISTMPGINGEHIQQATLVNDSLIIYLSDANRGVGFYTLRFRNP